MNKKSISLLLGLAFLLSLILTVYLWFSVNHSNPDYTEVQAKVLSSEQKVKKVKNTRITTYEVKLVYEGKTYDLINAHSTVPYQPLQDATVYFSNGNLYADIEGIKSTSPLGKLYFVFLALPVIMLVVWLTYRSKRKQQERESR